MGRAVAELLKGKPKRADKKLEDLLEQEDATSVEMAVNRAGYQFLGADKAELARDVFVLNTRVFPEAFNTWDSLGEAHMTLGDHEEAIRCYEKSLELNEDNQNAVAMIARMREEGTEAEE